MKRTNILYGISLLSLGIGTYLIVQYPDSNRLSLLAGVLQQPGFP